MWTALLEIIKPAIVKGVEDSDNKVNDLKNWYKKASDKQKRNDENIANKILQKLL